MMLVSAAVIGLIVVTWRRRGRAPGRDGSGGDFAADFGGGHGHHSGQDHSGASGGGGGGESGGDSGGGDGGGGDGGGGGD